MSRITVVDNVYYQVYGEEPERVQSKFTCDVGEENDDLQVWHRKTKVGEEPTEIDCGWMDPKQIGMAVIENPSPPLSKNPTDLELAAQKAAKIQIEWDDGQPVLLIPKGASIRFIPVDLSRLRIRSLRGTIKVNIHLFPGNGHKVENNG